MFLNGTYIFQSIPSGPIYQTLVKTSLTGYLEAKFVY